jgi:O-antigen/teichoic acid export membrane protein
MGLLMRSRLFWRRSAAAAGIYASVVLGFFGTVIAAHAFSTHVLGLYALVIAATGFFQTLLDLTIEEALVKYGFRFQEREDWGRLRTLFGRALQVKLTGGLLAGLFLLALAPAAPALFGDDRLVTPFLIAAALPLVQAPENVGGVALILRGRYDIRAFFLLLSMALRLGAIAIGTRYGLTQTIAAIVVAQILATAAVLGAGWIAYRRNPRAASIALGDERPEIVRFVLQSSVATGVVALRSTLTPLLLGVVSSPTQVGYFRVAQTPQQGFAALSAPARLVLLTEQTRAWERGTRKVVFAGVRRYSRGAALGVLVAVPLLLWLAPDLVRIFFTSKNVGATNALRLIVIAGAIQFIFGWTKSFPVSIGRPNLRIWTHGVETVVLVPLVVAFGALWGATGAAGAVLAATVVFVVFWSVLFMRIRREPDSSPPAPPQTAEMVAP